MAYLLGTEVNDSYKILTYAGTDPILKPYESMIYSDWLKSLRYGNGWFKCVDPSAYFEAYERIVKALLSRGVVRLAVLTEDLDTCLGWSLCEDDKLHYVFVKVDQRKQGIGRSLYPDKINQVTHLTNIGRSIWEEKLSGVIFNPF